jgi:hypothetical protein
MEKEIKQEKKEEKKYKIGEIISEPNSLIHKVFLGDGWFATDKDFEAIVLSKLVKLEKLADET